MTPETVTWLWEGRIPWGKLTVLEGDPGVGKSTLSSLIAAHVSSGKALLPNASPCSGSTVILLPSFEDGTADTVVPRLLAAGADLSRIHELRGVQYDGERQSLPLRLPSDVDVLRREIESRKAKLVLIDSLTTCLGSGVDSYKDGDIRSALAPLARVADETGVAVVVIRHFTKSSRGTAVAAGGGSIAIAGVARVILQVHKDPNDEKRRVLAVAKCNVGVIAPSLQFALHDAGTCARIVWEGESSHSADDLVTLRTNDEGERELLSEVGDWLRDLLRDRELPRQELAHLAKSSGYSASSLTRAAKRVGVKHRRCGFPSQTFWYLPDSIPIEREDPFLLPYATVASTSPSHATRTSIGELTQLDATGASATTSNDHGGTDDWVTLTL